MKKHTSSRSRSRSRSRSPSYNRDKKYPRGYQNNREFWGYQRGFRRPYNFRGRGRGNFPRGRYQRGGGNYNNNNNYYYFRPNWKNYKQQPQKQQHPQKQQQQQQNSSRGRLRSFQKRSGSPPHGQSHQSDRSSSPLSRHSQHSSSSHSSSPKCRPALLLANQNSKEEGEAPKEIQKGGGEDEKPVQLVGVLAGDAKEGSGNSEGNCQGLTDCNSSPKRNSPLANSAVTVGQNSQTTNQNSSSPKYTKDISNGAPSWQMQCSSSSTKKPLHEGLNPMLSSFDFFSSEEFPDGDKTAISIAFRKFLEEQNKKVTPAWENGRNTESNDVDMEKGKVNGKASAVNSDSVSRKYKEDTDGGVSLNSFLKASPFLSAHVEEEEEMIIKPHLKSLHKDWHNGDDSSKPKSKVPHSAQELFEECFGKWQKAAYSQVANSKLDSMAGTSQKQDTAAIATALTKRELAGNLSPDMTCKARKMAKSPSIPSPTPLPKRNSDREMFMVRGENVPLMSSRKHEAKVNVRMDFLGDSLISSSDILAEERQLSQDLVQSSKKNQEFRSIFQHVQTAQLKMCPSELFAQHIVAIVHHIKSQHFASPGMTLNERFTMYQRRAAEKEMMMARKSPEIHRRIDVSPSAFKKHSQLFEAMKSSEDCTYKDAQDEKMKGDPMDLRLDIERRKKYSTHERDFNQDRGKDMEESPDSSRDRSVEKYSKCHKKSKKKKKKRSRSSSSSSSASSKYEKEDSHHDKSDSKDKEFNRVQLGERDLPGPEKGRPRGGFQVRIRGRSWSRGNCQANSTDSNPINTEVLPKSEDWDPEYTPKSKEYYLHDDRDGEAECKWMDNRGRGRGSFTRGRARFIIRKATGSSNAIGPKWASDKFHINGGQGGVQDQVEKQDHKEGETDGENT